jgi:4-amino-4-deoxy-L-arabinose transferase-like glycosyltransferase
MSGHRTTPWNLELNRLAARFLGAVVVVRLLCLVLFVAQFDLAPDESYYWDWGRRLAWGYYSKPPMIGWLMGIVGRLSWNSLWGIRLVALLMGTVSLWLLHRLALRLFGQRAALTTLLLAALTPANTALSLFLTIDAPLVLLWTAALLAFWGAVEKPDGIARWAALCVLLGLGYLSKQMMLVFPLLMILFCALTPPARPILRRPAFWTCVGLSLLFLLPPVIWNANHGWVTFRHTGHHFEVAAGASLPERLAGFGMFIGSQLLIFTPLTWLMMITTAVGGLWKWKTLGTNERYAVLFSGPALVVFLALALRQEVNPNWPAVHYLAAIALAGAWVEHTALSPLRWQRLQRLKSPALILALIVTACACVLPIAARAMGLAGKEPFDPALRLRGWREAGAQAGEFLKNVPRPARTFVVVLGHRDHASQLAFHIPQHPRVYRFAWADVTASQYEIWQRNGADPGDDGFIGGDALVFSPPDLENAEPGYIPDAFKRQFEDRNVRKLGEIHAPAGAGQERRYDVYLGGNLKFWDPPLSPAARAAQAPQAEAAGPPSGDVAPRERPR